MKNTILISALLSIAPIGSTVLAQQGVGINHIFPPEESLEIWGEGETFLRIHATGSSNNRAAVELIRGNDDAGIDWRIENNDDGLSFASSTDEFDFNYSARMHFDDEGYLGIGTSSPKTRLHLIGGPIANNTSNGFMVLGDVSAINLAFDQNGFVARSNGLASILRIQDTGGSTYLGLLGTTNVVVPGGRVAVGSGNAPALLSVRDGDQFGLNVRNSSDGTINSWYISSTSSDWSVGPNKLVFTPTSSSTDSPLRLHDVADNDGSSAPLMVRSSPTKAILFDGNEIDGYAAPLRINSLSQQNTYINSAGGKIGIGTTNPHGQVHIVSDYYAFGIEEGSTNWEFSVLGNGDLMASNDSEGNVSFLDNVDGLWHTLSDSTSKHNIQPVTNAMEKISEIELKQYRFRNYPSGPLDIGVIAQELEKILPEAVSIDEGTYGVMYDQLAALAVAGIQEQQKKIEALLEQCDKMLSNK